MNAPGKIVLYFIAVFALGAALAPPLFWCLQAALPEAKSQGWLRMEPQKNGEIEAKGPAAFLDASFIKVSNRAILIAAAVLLWPLFRSLRIHSTAELGLRPNPRRFRDFAFGFLVSVGCMGLLAFVLLHLGIYKMKEEPPWGDLLSIAISGITVGVLEEWMFRAAILGSFRKSMNPWVSLACVSAIFSVLHFVTPPNLEIPADQVGWLSGFALVPQRFEGFSKPLLFLGGFTTLFCFGWVCGWAVIRTGSLALSIGFHAGMVLGKFGFNRLTKRPKDMRDLLPWIGEDMTVGLVGVAMILIIGSLLWLLIRKRPTPQ